MDICMCVACLQQAFCSLWEVYRATRSLATHIATYVYVPIYTYVLYYRHLYRLYTYMHNSYILYIHAYMVTSWLYNYS